MAKWFGAHYNQEVRFSSAVKCKKGPQVLTSLLTKDEIIIIIIIIHPLNLLYEVCSKSISN